jgi:hypothetical protein
MTAFWRRNTENSQPLPASAVCDREAPLDVRTGHSRRSIIGRATFSVLKECWTPITIVSGAPFKKFHRIEANEALRCGRLKAKEVTDLASLDARDTVAIWGS